jgi:hypothetical protein
MNMVRGPPQTVGIWVAVGVAVSVGVSVLVDVGVIVKVGVGETINGVNRLTAAQLIINKDRKIRINKLKGLRFSNCMLPSISRNKWKIRPSHLYNKTNVKFVPTETDEKNKEASEF